MINSLRNFHIRAFVAMDNLKSGAQSQMAGLMKSSAVPMTLFAMALALFPFDPLFAQSTGGLTGLLGGWEDTVRQVIDFVMIAALLLGVCAIAYGLKLIWDKSNERENVKTGQIIFSLVGGAALCTLWFIVNVMSDTVTGGAGTVGTSAAF